MYIFHNLLHTLPKIISISAKLYLQINKSSAIMEFIAAYIMRKLFSRSSYEYKKEQGSFRLPQRC